MSGFTLQTPKLRLHAPSVTALTRRATSPVSLRYTGQEQGVSLLPRKAGEVSRRATARRDGGGFSLPRSFGGLG
jgi:hypothetical protein